MGKMKDLLYNIELWKKHLSENPTEIIEVVAVIAATHDLLTIEEEDETKTSTHGDQGGTGQAQADPKAKKEQRLSFRIRYQRTVYG